MKLLSAPFYALFSRQFYTKAAFAGAGRGSVYLLYLSGLMLLAAATAVSTRLLPQANEFAVWLQSELPALQWTPAGLSMKGQTAFALIHPEYGPLAQFDMNLSEVSDQEMGDNSIFVTSQKVYMRQPGRAGFKIYDVTQLGDKNAQPFEIRPELIGQVYARAKPWLLFLLLGSFWVMFLIWKILAALFYSWVALLINMMRREKLHYSHLWTLACFALTPAALVQSLQFAFPPLAVIPFGLIGSFFMTSAYLYLAIKGTESPLADSPSDPS